MNKKVDALGRIVIPIGLRKKYNLNEGTAVTFKEECGTIYISPVQNLCKLCQKKLDSEKAIPVCKECIQMLKAQT